MFHIPVCNQTHQLPSPSLTKTEEPVRINLNYSITFFKTSKSSSAMKHICAVLMSRSVDCLPLTPTPIYLQISPFRGPSHYKQCIRIATCDCHLYSTAAIFTREQFPYSASLPSLPPGSLPRLMDEEHCTCMVDDEVIGVIISEQSLSVGMSIR